MKNCPVKILTARLLLKLTIPLFVTAATALAGNPLDTWQTIQPTPGAQRFGRIAYGDGRWVGGSISSSNGIDWVAGSLSHDFALSAFGYANGLWVGGGIRLIRPVCSDAYQFCDALLTSTNGLDWTHHAEATDVFCDLEAPANFTDVAFGNGRWIVLGGYHGRYLTSTDGVNWTPHGLAHLAQFRNSQSTRAVAYGNGTWLIAGDIYYPTTNALFTSSDGLNWAGPVFCPGYFSDVNYANGQWVASGQHQIWSSTNGLNWTSRYQGVAGQDNLFSVRFANGRWLCVGYRYASSYVGLVLTSTDALNWTLLRQDADRFYSDSAYANNQWDIVGGDTTAGGGGGALLTSSNGTTWTDRTVRSTVWTAKLRFAAGRWMSVGENTNQVTIATSTDGISWSNVAPFVGTTSSSGAVAYGDGQWLAFGGRYLNAPFRAEGVTMISTNGTSWLVQTNIIPFSLGLRYALAFGQDKWVMFTKFFNTNVYTASSSNFNWTPTPLPSFPGAGSFSDVHFANGLWVAVGYLPTATNPVPLIITSPNGTNWTRRSVSVTNATLDAVAYAQGQWVAVGSESIYFPLCSIYPVSTALVLTSLDGANWIRRDTSLPRGPDVISRSSLSGITWTGDEWVAVGLYQVLTERALLLTSPDAITWQMHVSVIGAGLEFAAYGNSRVVAGGATTLLLSAPIVPAAPVLGLNRAGNQLSLFLSGSIGATYDIEQAAQLVPPSWATVQSLTLSNASQQILVSPATNSSAYWRAHRL